MQSSFDRYFWDKKLLTILQLVEELWTADQDLSDDKVIKALYSILLNSLETICKKICIGKPLNLNYLQVVAEVIEKAGFDAEDILLKAEQDSAKKQLQENMSRLEFDI